MGPLPKSPRLLALLVGLVSTLPYWQTLWSSNIDYDDPWLLRANYLLQNPSWAGLNRIWLDLSSATRLLLGAEYLPVRDMSVMLNFAIFGTGNYWGFHLVNLILHGLICGVAVLLVHRWTGGLLVAFICGLLFALHPLHVESVTWLSEHKGLLAALFSLLSALAFHRFVRAPTPGRWLMTALLLVLAIWSKAVGVAAVGFLAALILLFPDQAGKKGRALLIGMGGLALIAALAMAPVFQVGSSLVLKTAHHGDGLLDYTWLAMRILGLSLKHLLLIGPFGVRYAIPDGVPWGIAAGLVGVAFTLGSLVLAGLGLFRRGSWRIPALAAASFWAFYLPASQLLFPLQNLTADRYMFLPSLGFCLLAAHALDILRSRRLGIVLALALALLGGVMSTFQANSWGDDRRLSLQALRAKPGDLRALLRLSVLAREEGNLKGALSYLNHAEAIHGEATGVLLHRALLKLRQGQTSAAVSLLRRAARQDPLADKVRANLALLLLRQGPHALPEALGWAKEAVRIRPQLSHNQRTFGIASQSAKRFNEAEQAFLKVVDMEPANAINWYNLALARANQGKRREAMQDLRGALKLKPGLKSARELLNILEKGEQR